MTSISPASSPNTESSVEAAAPSRFVPLRDREPPLSLLYYRMFKWAAVTPMFHLYCRGRIYGKEKLPRTGPVILVSNHASDFDPPFIAAGLERPVAFMAKEELFKVPILGPAIRGFGAYPVKRGSADRSAIRAALASLEQGWAAGLFLDGTRRPDGRIHDPKLGAAMIAAKTQAPLLPVSIWGTEHILPEGAKFVRPVPVTIRVGEMIAPPASGDRAALEATTQACVAAVMALHDLGR